MEKTGVVKGLIRDSVHNHAIKSATVAIYAVPDGKVVSYQVSNNLGEFLFKDIPTSTNLKLVISNIGYQQFSKKFTFPDTTSTYDFGAVFIDLKINELEEVTVTPPPVQMNGDTLEFNPAAFALDSNAVVHDLMKKIPNITLWGDGTITVNGREIKTLLVNGKEFFGGDPKISIENIPKNAVDKIQVYNTLANSRNLLDSSLNMNLKLKPGKEVGYFGKIGGGYGTGNRFETDLNFNAFSPKLQVSLGGASNNVNKIPSSINTLLRNSTYKGVGVQIDYMPDFRTSGINQPNSVGYTFKYDFVDPVAKTQNKNAISSKYFLQNNQIQQKGNSQTTTAVNNHGNILENKRDHNIADRTGQQFNMDYQFAKDRYYFIVSQNVNLDHNKSSNHSTNISSNDDGQIVSQSTNTNSNNGNEKSYGFNTALGYEPNIWDLESRFSGVDVDYSLNISEKSNKMESFTSFQSINDSTKNKLFSRNYNTRSQSISQNININLPNIIQLILGVNRFHLFDINMENGLLVENNKNNNRVYDYDGATNGLLPNQYLTNVAEYNSLIYEPVLMLHKTISKSLTNRFDRSWGFSFRVKGQLYYQNNRSDKDFQDINRTYTSLLPSFKVNFSDNQYGEYRRNVVLGYDNRTVIPSIGQIAPLTDSMNIYSIQIANLGLKEERVESVSMKFKHINERKNNFEYELAASYNRAQNGIIDKILIDAQNIRTKQAINNSNNGTYDLSGRIKKSIKLKESEMQLHYNTRYNHSKRQTNINDTYNTWYTDYFNNRLIVNFTLNENIAVEAIQTVTNSFSKDLNERALFKNTDFSTAFSISYHVNKRLTTNSNISFSKNMSTGSAAINYNIWNANVAYRLLKGNNLEVKLSALDLLRQNTSIVNFNQEGVLVTGNRNVLQQYFIFGISYYPRRFGFRK
ncbi:outer membrane beta-barrel protein [Parapedobacter sp. 10938]|uniref:outer membrane beta-barrel protein n=1 Tax=Parapedobacter flavus TaxID=3110225 RepID=UPI002DBDEA75|nr:hypothetical protein [Parapedobacter sp. 10938]MEC3878156.1 hypothetical protein [Parapedobacter sp. 10938]